MNDANLPKPNNQLDIRLENQFRFLFIQKFSFMCTPINLCGSQTPETHIEGTVLSLDIKKRSEVRFSALPYRCANKNVHISFLAAKRTDNRKFISL